MASDGTSNYHRENCVCSAGQYKSRIVHAHGKPLSHINCLPLFTVYPTLHHVTCAPLYTMLHVPLSTLCHCVPLSTPCHHVPLYPISLCTPLYISTPCHCTPLYTMLHVPLSTPCHCVSLSTPCHTMSPCAPLYTMSPCAPLYTCSMGGAIAVRAAAGGAIPSLVGLAVIDVVEGESVVCLGFDNGGCGPYFSNGNAQPHLAFM